MGEIMKEAPTGPENPPDLVAWVPARISHVSQTEQPFLTTEDKFLGIFEKGRDKPQPQTLVLRELKKIETRGEQAALKQSQREVVVQQNYRMFLFKAPSLVWYVGRGIPGFCAPFICVNINVMETWKILTEYTGGYSASVELSWGGTERTILSSIFLCYFI